MIEMALFTVTTTREWSVFRRESSRMNERHAQLLAEGRDPAGDKAWAQEVAKFTRDVIRPLEREWKETLQRYQAETASLTTPEEFR